MPGNKEDVQARFIDAQVQVENPFNIVSLYLPNGNPIDTDKFPYKLDWMRRFKKYAQKKYKFLICSYFKEIRNNY